MVRWIAGGAGLLPLLAYGHGAEFLDARFELRDGVLRLRIVADYGGNPMIADEAEARKVLADALRIELGATKTQHRLDELAPLKIIQRATRDTQSPMPQTEANPEQPHQLLTAYWRWAAPDGEVKFFAPETRQQTVLFWLREPNVSPPRWSLLVPGDRTPGIIVKSPCWKHYWLWGAVIIGVNGFMGYRFAYDAYTPVGRQGLNLIVHHLAKRPGTDDYVQRVAQGMAASKTRLNDGHGDNSLAWGWALLGIQLSGNDTATRAVFDYNKAFINMARTHDGAFVIQPGRNLHEKAYYMSPRIHPTAAMVLALGTDKPRLRIQGVNGKPKS